MLVKFEGPVKIDGVHYPKGNHEVPDALSGHWYLKALVKDGKASIAKPAKEVPAPAAKPIAPPKGNVGGKGKAPAKKEEEPKG